MKLVPETNDFADHKNCRTRDRDFAECYLAKGAHYDSLLGRRTTLDKGDRFLAFAPCADERTRNRFPIFYAH